MCDGIADDVGYVVIGDAVHHGLPGPLGTHQTPQAQHAQVLGHQGLSRLGEVLQLGYPQRTICKVREHHHSQRVTQGAEQVGCQGCRRVKLHAPSQPVACRYSN